MGKSVMICGLVLGGMMVVGAEEPEEPLAPALVEISKVEPKAEVFKVSSANKPLVLSTREEAAKYFEDKQLEALTKQMDFSKQKLVVFAWRGSGQDEMQSVIAESFPEQIHFTVKRGLTRDLRPHIKLYALRANVILRP